ncbi:hypothetical protein AWC15_15690 [Mycobacterium lacus]|uniref:Uncharacterized protein n=1 Tax=Mycobacterium lacus TaxID=169765 RepID=A0A1X1YM91_9MYCO|nr:hypothetical protein AWC15_15690 [Mycobacterium lacus]BBX95876.1 hypothetical protein MLAC_11700 [Mycobacterium lacus]
MTEDAPWSAFRDREDPYGFAAFDVDPGGRQYVDRGDVLRGDRTVRAVTAIDQLTLTKPRP